jgi:hypothetical protein
MFSWTTSPTRGCFTPFISTKSTEGFWHNTTMAKAEELRSLDDLLDPSGKAKLV